MPTEKEKTQIRESARNGKSVNKIKEELNLPKSTVYYHFKKEVGQKQKENALKLPDNDEIIGEICGIFAGDGYFKKYDNGHYTIIITLNYKQNYWKKLKSFLKEELDKEPQVLRQESRARLKYDSKKLHDFLKTYLDWEEDKTATIQLKEGKEFSREFKQGFLRGLIDTDGSLNRTRYSFNTISENLNKDTMDLLEDLNIECSTRVDVDKRSNCRDMHRAVVGRESMEKFYRQIAPRHPNKQFRS